MTSTARGVQRIVRQTGERVSARHRQLPTRHRSTVRRERAGPDADCVPAVSPCRQRSRIAATALQTSWDGRLRARDRRHGTRRPGPSPRRAVRARSGSSCSMRSPYGSGGSGTANVERRARAGSSTMRGTLNPATAMLRTRTDTPPSALIVVIASPLTPATWPMPGTGSRAVAISRVVAVEEPQPGHAADPGELAVRNDEVAVHVLDRQLDDPPCRAGRAAAGRRWSGGRAGSCRATRRTAGRSPSPRRRV